MAGVVAAHGIAAGMQAIARQLASRKAARRKERRRDNFDTRWRSATTCVPSTTPLIPWPVMVMPKIVLSKLLNRIVASLRSRAAKKRNRAKLSDVQVLGQFMRLTKYREISHLVAIWP